MTREFDRKARTSKKDFKRGRSLSPSTGRMASPSVTSMTDLFKKPGGIGWFVAALFLADDMAGGGLVTLPTAMVRTGIIVSCLNACLNTQKSEERNLVTVTLTP
uniref:Transmembrane amino acid transporter n=1 Tax=Haemonchus contortus TaxID=6289 RepID=W6NDQ4_HAECO